MSANDIEVAQLEDEIDAAPREVPLSDQFKELQLTSDERMGDPITVFFDGELIEEQAAYIWVAPDDVVELEEVR